MYWANEYNTKEKDVKRLHRNEDIFIGVFGGIVALILMVGVVL